MKNKGIDVYKNVVKDLRCRVKDTFDFKFSFDYGPKVDMVGNNSKTKRTIKYKDLNTNQYVFETETSPGLFTSVFRRWFTPWRVEVYEGTKEIWSFDFESSLHKQKILVSIDSSSLGDTLAWVPVVEALRNKYQADVIVTTFWNSLLKQFFPQLKFFPPGYRDHSVKAVFGVGWYEEEDRNCHRRDPRSISLQQVAGDILGIDVKTDLLPPQLPNWLNSLPPRESGKYVCLATESTANAKHWHYEKGWQTIVDYLRILGYEVRVIHKQNNTLEGVVDKTGDRDILQRMADIYQADFFIGIGSGLSWLAWFLQKPVVMISGFSDPFCEFSRMNYRVINRNVCHGCFNDVKYKFDRGDWNWCPRLKNTERMFECTTKLSPQLVIEQINLLIQEQGL